MKTANIRQVRNDFGTVLGWVEAGEEVTILKRRQPVARLCPIRPPPSTPVVMPDFAARARATFGTRDTAVSDAVLREREQGIW